MRMASDGFGKTERAIDLVGVPNYQPVWPCRTDLRMCGWVFSVRFYHVYRIFLHQVSVLLNVRPQRELITSPMLFVVIL